METKHSITNTKLYSVLSQTTITLSDSELEDLTHAVSTAHRYFDSVELTATAGFTLDLLTKLQDALNETKDEETTI